MSNVADLGSEGDVVTVADGYARNYLFPKNLGAPVTEATRRRLAKMQEQREKERKVATETAQKLANKISELSCTIPVKVGEDGGLFGSVSAQDIVTALADQSVEIDKNALNLAAPIKELGVFDVAVQLDQGVETKVKVWVVEE
jgi:large subunit ribosomal protein L9